MQLVGGNIVRRATDVCKRDVMNGVDAAQIPGPDLTGPGTRDQNEKRVVTEMISLPSTFS